LFNISKYKELTNSASILFPSRPIGCTIALLRPVNATLERIEAAAEVFGCKPNAETAPKLRTIIDTENFMVYVLNQKLCDKMNLSLSLLWTVFRDLSEDHPISDQQRARHYG
jgi:hypothetical protein